MKIMKPINITQRNILTVLCIGVVLSTSLANVRADVLAVKGRTPTVGVKLIQLKNGKLHYRSRHKRLLSRPIEQIEYLQIAGWPLFNLAEKQQRDKHFRQAINSYEKVLTELSDSDRSGRLDRKLLVQCRLLRACDLQGRFDRAVELYLEIIERSPQCLETLRPVKLPATGSMFFKSARPLLEAAIGRHPNDNVGASLRAWLNTWPQQQITDRPPATENLPTAPVAESGPILRVREALPEIQRQIEAGQFERALIQIKTLNNMSAGKLRADLYYLKGRALLGKSLANNHRDHLELNVKRAGLAFMRIVIHWPEHEYRPECLYQTGQICKQLELHQQAAGLWAELTGSYPKANPWSKRAQKALEKL
ncbi:MAG: tetratricopeptide repeat protein [Planctomycetota bacterium]|jgi:tetratricopeptide (TPR) repeat protein